MAKPEWGRKRTCQVCGKKYYDFNKSPIICPCPEAVEFDPDLLLKSRKGKGQSSKTMVANNNDLTDDIDDIEIDTDNEVISDDDALLEINKDDKDDITDDEIGIDDDINFIQDEEITDEDEISDENSINVEIIEENKD